MSRIFTICQHGAAGFLFAVCINFYLSSGYQEMCTCLQAISNLHDVPVDAFEQQPLNIHIHGR